MSPIPGRTVLYRIHPADRTSRSIDGDTLPAMVIRVNDDGSVNLKVFNDCGIDFVVRHSFEGEEGEGRWSWPPRVN